MISFLVPTISFTCGWVGNMNYPSGSINSGSEYLTYIQVYQDGTTNPIGQGSGIDCYVTFGSVSSFGGSWSNIQTLTMDYHSDDGNNDVYVANIGINLSQGLWEYNCYCNCGNGDMGNQNGGNAQLTVSASLPVKLNSFTSFNHFNQTHLHWSTVSELNNDYFEVEFSKDGYVFTPVGRVRGYGNSSDLREYAYIHENRNVKVAYYRLKQVDYDGQYEYSKILKVSFSDYEFRQIKLSPNPAQEMLRIEGMEDTTFSIEVSDYLGRILKVFPYTSYSDINITDLNPGMYWIKIKSETTVQDLPFLKL